MKTFKQFVKIEQKKLKNRYIYIIGGLFLGLALIFTGIGIDQYKNTLHEKKENFKEIEQAKVKKYMNYEVYGAQGVRIFFVPSPLSIYCHKSGVFSGLSAALDIGERLNLTHSYIGPEAFKAKDMMYDDFIGLHLLFGTLMALIYGFFSFRNRAYQDMLGSLGGFRKIYINTAGARFLLLAIFFTAVTVLATLMIVLFGIPLTGAEYLYVGLWLGYWLLVESVIFTAGVLIGAAKSNWTGGTALVLVWIFLFYIAPLIVNQTTEVIAESLKSIYQLEKEKWDALMNFEERGNEELGKFKLENRNTPSEQEMIESFMNREFKDMMALEKGMEQKMRDKIDLYRWLSFISPNTLLMMMMEEACGKGYGTLVGFYENVQGVKVGFSQFYKDKKFYSKSDTPGVESYIKDEENVYYGGRGGFPNWPWALTALAALFLVLQFSSYRVYKKRVEVVGHEAAAAWDPGLSIPAKGEYGVWQIEEEAFSRRLYNYFVSQGYTCDFLYLCHVEEVPGDIGTGDFLELAAALQGVSLAGRELYWEKRWDQLKKVEKFKVLMTVTELAERAGRRFYFFHDLIRQMPFEVAVLLKERMEGLSSRGGAVMFLLRDQVVSDSGMGNSYGIRKSLTWSEQVENWQKILEG